MSVAPGFRLGPYEVISALGAGGMGEVYRARDQRLDRIVAIKILSGGVAADPDLRRRFDREAKAISSLNHPHICALYDVGHQDGLDYLVMEYLEGDTLAERLARTAGSHHPGLPVDQALTIAIEMADALDRAHRAGIVHRDLKPANIFLTKSGTKLLDFGLAKMSAPGIGAAVSALPTVANLTAQGTILGTLQYMAPEQLEGHEADARADLFALGAVLYELLTGRKAFEGKSQASLIGAILKDHPPLVSSVRPLAPASLDRIVSTCLAKDPEDRWQSARDLMRELKWIARSSSSSEMTHAAPARPSRRARLAWSLAAVCLATLLLLVGTLAYVVWHPTPGDGPEMRLQMVTPPAPSSNVTSFAISPDGRTLVFAASDEGRIRLMLRPLESETAQPLAGTDDARFPFWSPDSRSVAFFAGSQLKRIDIVGGALQTLAIAPIGLGGTWNDDGVIVYAPSTGSPLYRVPAGGGPALEATRLDPPRQRDHRFPYFLPDGRHFLFFAMGTPEHQGIYLGSLDSTEPQRLLDAETAAVYVPPDRLLFARQGVLLSQRLDLERLTASGEPSPVAGTVAVSPGTVASVGVSAALAGLVAYRGSPGESQLMWHDRSGRQIETLGGRDAGQPSGIRLSPDGRFVALRRTVSGNDDVWLIETARGLLRRFTLDAASDSTPIWSPDGRRIVFTSTRTGIRDLYERLIDGVGPDTLLLTSPEGKNVDDWSPDGRFILYPSQAPKTGRDLWVLPLFGDRKPSVVAQTALEDVNGQFSPDGRWIAYQSNETGRNEIYVQPFPGLTGKQQVSTGGGRSPQWRRDGRELFFLAPDNRLMAVPVTLHGSDISPGTPAALFWAPLGSQEYTASPDGQRFLINKVVQEASPITVLLNWKPHVNN